MTLLLNLVGPRAIHQSSDYRLTTVPTLNPIEDEFGSKQIYHLAGPWMAQISFTGFAQIGNRKTRDWIIECLNRADISSDPAVVLNDVAATAAHQLRQVPQERWFLIIVATIYEKGAIRFFAVSCMGNPMGPPLTQPLDHFQVYEIPTTVPRELIFGRADCVSTADRKFLSNLNRGKLEATEVRRALARINARSARRSNGAVSEGCLVTSTMPDGTSQYENIGGTPGITADTFGTSEMADLFAKLPRSGPLTLTQGASSTGYNVRQITSQPMKLTEGGSLIVKVRSDLPVMFMTNELGRTMHTPKLRGVDEDTEWAKFEESLLATPAGPARNVAFSSNSDSLTLKNPDGSIFGIVEIWGAKGDAVVMNNRVSKITLANVAARTGPGFRHSPQPTKDYFFIKSVPTIDGAEPHGWSYTIELSQDGSGCELSIHRNSVALRSTIFPRLSSVTDSEELVVVSSMRPATIKISSDQPSGSAHVDARLFVRAIPQPSNTAQTESK